jgi:hypothetical protein
MFAASLLPLVLIGVVGDAQVYFVVYGFLAASVVSAAGLTTVVGALRLKAADVIVPGLLCAAGVLTIVIDLWTGRSTVALVPAYAFLACIVFVTTWLAYRREAGGVTVNARRRILTLGAVVLVCLTVASEPFEQTAPTIDRWLRGEPAFESSGTSSHRGITTNLLRGMAWLRNHSQPSAVIAVNNHELGGNGGSRYFYYSAFSERRVFLESRQLVVIQVVCNRGAHCPHYRPIAQPRLQSRPQQAMCVGNLVRQTTQLRRIVVKRPVGGASRQQTGKAAGARSNVEYCLIACRGNSATESPIRSVSPGQHLDHVIDAWASP